MNTVYFYKSNKAFQLVLALKGNAAEILTNFDEIMNALHRKYGSDHKIEMYRVELRRRMQKVGVMYMETLLIFDISLYIHCYCLFCHSILLNILYIYFDQSGHRNTCILY